MKISGFPGSSCGCGGFSTRKSTKPTHKSTKPTHKSTKPTHKSTRPSKGGW